MQLYFQNSTNSEKKNRNGSQIRLSIFSGHYFIVWLMMKNTYFTVLYTNATSDEYKEATKRIIYEVGLSTVVDVL